MSLSLNVSKTQNRTLAVTGDKYRIVVEKQSGRIFHRNRWVGIKENIDTGEQQYVTVSLPRNDSILSWAMSEAFGQQENNERQVERPDDGPDLQAN